MVMAALCNHKYKNSKSTRKIIKNARESNLKAQKIIKLIKCSNLTESLPTINSQKSILDDDF